MEAITNIVLFLGIALFAGAPLWMACYIAWEIATDKWGETCSKCHTTIYTEGCRCTKGHRR